MKNERFLRFVILLLLLTGLTVFFYYRPSRSDEETQKQVRLMVASRIYDAVEAKLNGPFLVAKTMAGDVYLMDALDREEERDEEEMVTEMRIYLEGVKTSTKCSTAFLVSDATNRYYTEHGLNKVIAPSSDPHDVWYPKFLNSSVPYMLNVDTDEDNGLSRTIFIDTVIRSRSQSLLGVCGVGIPLGDLQKMFLSYEKTYQCKVNLVDDTGLVMVDSDSINVETTTCDISSAGPSSQFFYEPRGLNGYTVIKYLDGFHWYLVVADNRSAAVKEAEFSPEFLVWGLVFFLLTSLAGYFLLVRSPVRVLARKNRGDSRKDPLTGLCNRNYFKEIYGEHGIFNTTRYQSIAVFDIDYFKEANDTLDGDDVLLMVTKHVSDIVGEKGQIFRWGGDEFMMLLELPAESAYDLCRWFCSEVAKDGRVTVSVGVTEVRLSDTIKKNYYRAAQACYLVKEMGGNGVKRN